MHQGINSSLLSRIASCVMRIAQYDIRNTMTEKLWAERYPLNAKIKAIRNPRGPLPASLRSPFAYHLEEVSTPF